MKTDEASTIRIANLSDLDAIVEMRLALLREVGNLKHGDDISELAAANRRYFSGKISTNDCIVWVADLVGKLVSTSTLVRIEKPPVADNLVGVEGYVLNMYTLPEWRSKGIATALLAALITSAKCYQIPRLWLHATPSAVSVYERAGFISITDGDRTKWSVGWHGERTRKKPEPEIDEGARAGAIIIASRYS